MCVMEWHVLSGEHDEYKSEGPVIIEEDECNIACPSCSTAAAALHVGATSSVDVGRQHSERTGTRRIKIHGVLYGIDGGLNESGDAKE